MIFASEVFPLPDTGESQPNADEDEREQLYAHIAGLRDDLARLRASHDRLLAAASKALAAINLQFEFIGIQKLGELGDAGVALQAAIAAARRYQ